MRTKISRKVTLDISLDSSETINFCKGGKQAVSVSPSALFPSENMEHWELEITVQIDKNEKGRFDWVSDEPCKQKEWVRDEVKPT